MSANFTNITTKVSFSVAAATWTAVWNYSTISRLTFFVLQIVLNLSMLLFLIHHEALRIGFNVYLIGLLSANIFYAFGQYPVEILQSLYDHWWMSKAACSYYIYQSWVFVSVSIHMHVLITINRLWALTFPLSYRNQHNTRVACLFSVSIVVYVHIVCFPLFPIDELYYRPPTELGCFLDTAQQKLYSTIVNMVAFNLPVAAVVFSYPYILYKYLRRRRTKNAVRPSSMWINNQTDRNQRKTIAASQKNDNSVSPFFTLTLLTCSVMICWAPSQVYWTLDSFMDVSGLS
ncbi:melatonin receptor type 1B-like, partial [Paramacrobiotus metropolitanus]|uniref:melatonin receptor type 1B-like n=1 Tax=Paramacrobiotus metropolitanus TaxID=2943436 RepID=UPI002446110C